MIDYGGSPLAGRTVLVTGAGRNTGRAIALAYGRAGADVIVNTGSNREAAESVAAEIRALGRRALPIVADVGSADAVADMIARGRAELGPITMLVSNAAPRSSGLLREITAEQWRGVVDGILNAAFYCIKGVVEDMVSEGFGRIVAVTGDAPHAGLPSHAHVSAAKFGVEGLIRSIATELGPLGVTANIVSPNGIAVTQRRADMSNERGKAMLAEALQRTPIGRFTEMDEIADLCVFFSLPQSGYLTSQTVHPGGGFYAGY